MADDISEQPAPRRNRTWSFWCILFFAVLPLWGAVPAAWVHVVYTFVYADPLALSPARKVLFFVSVCEVLFSVYHYALVRRVSGPPPTIPAHPDEIQLAYRRLLKTGLAHLPADGDDEETLVSDRPGSPAEVITQLERHDPRAIDFRHCLRTWFLNVPWSSIRRHELMSWLYWAMYNAHMPPELSSTEKAALDHALDLLERRLGCKVLEGSNPSVTPMRLTVDAIGVTWRPFSFYALVACANWVVLHLYSRWHGVQRCASHGLEYLIRVPADWDQATGPRPVVFIHGLGLGLFQYQTLITHLLKTITDRPILIPLQPQISQNVFHVNFLKPFGRHEMADRVARVLESLGWVDLPEQCFDSDEEKSVADSVLQGIQKGITLLSHSNGSYTHSWMLKNYPDIVGRSAFVDPVTFCSWEGDVCYNFFYRTPKTGFELLMKYFVGSELGVVNYLQRHFCWTSNSLWFEEIPNARDPSKTIFFLGGKDDIIHSERVKRYLVSHGVRKNLWYDPNGRHGQALMPGSPGLDALIEWLAMPETH